jgi:acyl-CoA synthetase (NDP forming)/RimJ/RimL family protein N-acetyltransferase
MEYPPDYPTEWETHAVLRDGSTVEIRPIRPSDREALVRFHSQQSQESIYFRYFRYRPTLSEDELDHFTRVDYRGRMAFVAMQGHDLIAVARYETWPDRPVAEVAFFVHDDHYGKGLGTLMLEYLAAAARQYGLAGFTASVLPENYRMLGVFRGAGFDVSTRFQDGVIEVDLGIEVTDETSSAIADRHRMATARSVARILEARSVAVIGANREPGRVGHELVRNLVAGCDAGDGADAGPVARILPVNPSAHEILGLRCHPSVAAATEALRDGGTGEDDDGPDPAHIDLAIIAVRAELVVDLVRQCAEAGVGGLLIVSTGFAELDEGGAALEREVVELARGNGMRLIGPAAFGLLNTGHPVELRAVYHPVRARPGRVAVASQSGPLGAAVLERLWAEGVGVSSFVGVGNRADVSVNDLLDYWSLDPSTDAVVLYVENVGNLRNFSTAARCTSLAKPIITIRPSSPDQVELLRQAGVILVDEVSQLVEQVELAASQPPARGNRVALVSNSASVARLAPSACRRHGLRLVVPASVADAASHETVLVGDLDSVSLRPSGDPGDYERVVVAAAVSDEVDLILLALAPTAYFDRDALEGLLDRINRAIDKPVVAVGLIGPDRVRVGGLPVCTFPEEAARILGRHARYGQWRVAHEDLAVEGDEAATPETGAEPVVETGSEALSGDEATGGDDGAGPGAAEELIDRLLAGRRETVVTMASPDLPLLLEALGVPLAPWGIADSQDRAAELADEIGYPVVLKAANLASRSLGEWGGTAIDLHEPEDLAMAYGRMAANLGVAMRTSVVQRMIPSRGAAIRLELLQDPAFGAMISIGLGGSIHQASAPAARRFLPLDQGEAVALAAALDGDGGASSITLERGAHEAVVGLVERLATAAEVGDRVARVTLNPILLTGDRAVATDAEVVLRRREVDPLTGVRHL